MISKLAERLARLEASFVSRSSQDGPSRELVRIWLRAVAIALGGYPRPRQSVPPYLEDTFSDGFARGLGYTDHDDMEAQAEANPEEWGRRIERAHGSLCQRYEADGFPDHSQRGFRVLCAALDEWGAAKSHNPNWPESDDSDTLARALTFYGVRDEPTKTHA